MRIRTLIIAAAGLLMAATAAGAVDLQGAVQMISHTDLVMKDGSKMRADIVKMHGTMYIMVPVSELPDYLHQQVLRVMPR